MFFEHPAALFGLAALIVLLLLSFLKVRPRRVEVPSLVIWRRLRDRNPPIHELKRPRFSLALLLQMLAVACGVTAIARPMIHAQDRQPRHLIVALDTSASMNTRLPDGKTSFEHARAWIDTLASQADEFDLLYFDPAPQRAQGAEARTKLRELKPEFPRVNIESLLPMIEQLRRRDSQVVVATDRDIEARAQKLLVGRVHSDNVGIVALSVEGSRVFARLHNAGEERTVRLQLNRQTFERTVPRGASTLLMPFAGDSAELRILANDSLPDDDIAVATKLATARETVVGLWGGEPPQLLKALRAIDRVSVQRSPAHADLAVYYEVEPTSTAPLMISIAPRREFAGIALGPAEPVHDIALEQHPLLKYVDELPVKKAREVRIPGGRPLIVSGTRPIAAVAQNLVVLGFDPFDSEWQYLPSFAVFWANAVQSVRSVASEHVVVPANEWAEKRLYAPRPGRYTVNIEGQDVTLTASLLDVYESDNAGVWSVPEAPAWTGGTQKAARALDAVLIVATLLFVAASYLLEFNRREER